MMHPDIESRIGAHQIFAVLLVPTFNHPRHESASLRSRCLYEPRRWQSKTASAFASATALPEKLRREKDSTRIEKHGINTQDDFEDRESTEADWKQGWVCTNLPNFYNINSIIDRTTGSFCSADAVSTSVSCLIAFMCSLIIIFMSELVVSLS